MRNLKVALLLALLTGCGSNGTPANTGPADADAGAPMADAPHADTTASDLAAPQDSTPEGPATPDDVAADHAVEAAVPDTGNTDGAGNAETAGDSGGMLPAGLKATMITIPGNVTPGDKVMSDRLKARGFVVTMVSDAAVTTASVLNQDLIVISSSAESAPLGTKVRDVTIPVVSIENGEYGPMRMTGMTRGTDWDMAAAQTALRITMPGHPLAAGLSGTVTIASTAGELGWGVPGPRAAIIATYVDNPGRAVVFGYLTGDQMVGMAAPARRVGYAVREALAASLTADGLKIFDAAVTWALGK